MIDQGVQMCIATRVTDLSPLTVMSFFAVSLGMISETLRFNRNKVWLEMGVVYRLMVEIIGD